MAHKDHVRVILASDGLWDVCKFGAAVRAAHRAPDVKDLAKTLIFTAESEYFDNRQHEFMDDDTTVTVVDLVPSGERVVKKSGACCVIA